MGKHSEKNSYKLLCVKALHLALTVALFYVFWLLFRYGRLHGINRYGFRYNYYVTVAYAVLLCWFNRTYSSFLYGYSRIRALVFGQFLSQLFSAVLVYFAVSLAWNRFQAPWIFLPMLALQLLLDIVWSFYGTAYYFKLMPRRKTLLIYRNQLYKKRFGNIRGKPTERLYEITDELRYNGDFSGLEDKLAGYDAIFVAGVNSACRNAILNYCKENRIPGFFLPHVGDTIMREAEHVKAFDSPVLYVNRKELNPEYAIIKRLFDIVASGLALVVLSPVMLITALAIRLYDGGPAFYKQVRLTRDGKKFWILKFRSMRVDAEKDGVARLSTGKNDERITPIGRVIRKLRLDELPQLVNIFRGDMSVVGPRPERPELTACYAEQMPEFKLRLQVKAGLTGYAQVYGKYNTDPYEKLEFDLLYINNMSVLTDLQLCFATLVAVFNPESTEGIEPGQTSAIEQELYTENEYE